MFLKIKKSISISLNLTGKIIPRLIFEKLLSKHVFGAIVVPRCTFAVQSVFYIMAAVENCFLKLSEELEWRNNDIQNQDFWNFQIFE